ncbi:dihydrodipicolinate reductase [Nocardioides marmoriginsengisoli]|uniref:Dihydrodipicolinate reductase n=1 Tax=Nocardioides marmoriginsengisoli TaxID=661483 RepID=A0A3N0CGQ2_9ACTN|nr:dihydrodipicolinate reductase [Nocardioides marmoriginsengisoli]RNL62615.1 dihydrodipicolinate reductase [Nocardioides marmoriginsengisoli]
MADPYPSTSGRRVRIFQVATGNVGTEMIGRIQRHPDLELVGLHCYTADKIGRDAGEIVGIDPIGLVATGTIEEIIDAAPDCVTFHGVWPDFELYERVLEAGIDIVTTADQVTGHHRDKNHPLPDGRVPTEVLEAACQRGGSTFYGTGMNPGLAQVLSIVHTSDVADIEKVTCIESVDVSCHHSVDTWVNCGFGAPADDPEQLRKLELGTTVFGDGVHLMADALGLELDSVDFEGELGACTEDVDLGWFRLPKGSVGGAAFRYVGKVGGVPRVVLGLEWQMTPKTEPSWDVKGCYITQIDGDPIVYSKHMIIPRPGTPFDADAFAAIGMTVTGMPALNAIRAVVEARPGLITSADLPLRAFGGRFRA